MSTQLAMVIDATKCIDCKACMAACKIANHVPDGYWRNWIKPSAPDFTPGPRAGFAFQPGACMHCDNPTCVSACPTGATFKDKTDGTVKIDASLCIGCGNCIPACPYGARFRNPVTHVADKCNYCPERRAAGLLPACVDTCPTKARVFGDINDPESEAHVLLAEDKSRVVRLVNAETDTKPNMYYLGNPGPKAWPVKAEAPAPMRAMIGIAPLLKAAVAAAGIGVIGLGIKQYLIDRKKPENGKEGGHD
ncbi:4Fe-4S dicluster domain-containing protein [Desulfovibrio inopinatus]|uniref:4Fe-4S dicluster domain-containing protein n=1 Tax=Desulfovibrio inopinatus TaxID=102109 RepID=UPI000421B45E|nr:4Fe-4S dicluster domain-containing protein [Desulfovibrio inopinatus]